MSFLPSGKIIVSREMVFSEKNSMFRKNMLRGKYVKPMQLIKKVELKSVL